MAEAGDGAVDQLGIDRLQAFIVETVFLQTAQLEVLDQDIGLGDQLAHGLRPLRCREIDGDGTLAAVAGVVVGGGQVLAVLALDEGWSPLAGIITFGAFHLDDVGAEIGQHLPGPWTGEDAGEFDDTHAFQRGIGHEAPKFCLVGQALATLTGPVTVLAMDQCSNRGNSPRSRDLVCPAREIFHDDVLIHLVQAFMPCLGVNL